MTTIQLFFVLDSPLLNELRLAVAANSELDINWIYPWIGLYWIGWDDCGPVCKLGAQSMPFLSNYIYEPFAIPILPRLKVDIRIASGT